MTLHTHKRVDNLTALFTYTFHTLVRVIVREAGTTAVEGAETPDALPSPSVLPHSTLPYLTLPHLTEPN